MKGKKNEKMLVREKVQFIPLTEKQKELLIEVLKEIRGDGIEILKTDPHFHEFINGDTKTVALGIYNLSRSEDHCDEFIIVQSTQFLSGRIHQLKIGAVTVYISGSQSIRFMIPKNIK